VEGPQCFDIAAVDSEPEGEVSSSRPHSAGPSCSHRLSDQALDEALELRAELERVVQQALRHFTARVKTELALVQRDFEDGMKRSGSAVQKMQLRLDASARDLKARLAASTDGLHVGLREHARGLQRLQAEVVSLSAQVQASCSSGCCQGRAIMGADLLWGSCADADVTDSGAESGGGSSSVQKQESSGGGWSPWLEALEESQQLHAARADELAAQLRAAQGQQEALQKDVLELRSAIDQDLGARAELAVLRDTLKSRDLRMDDMWRRLADAEAGVENCGENLAGLSEQLGQALPGKADALATEEALQSHEAWMEELSEWLEQLRDREEAVRQLLRGQASHLLPPAVQASSPPSSPQRCTSPTTPLQAPPARALVTPAKLQSQAVRMPVAGDPKTFGQTCRG